MTLSVNPKRRRDISVVWHAANAGSEARGAGGYPLIAARSPAAEEARAPLAPPRVPTPVLGSLALPLAIGTRPR
jgi:hypothetical protein